MSQDYKTRLPIIIDLDNLAIDVGKSILASNMSLFRKNYIAHCINVIRPATRMLISGLDINENLPVANGLRTLLENLANTNYIFHDPSKTDDYAQKVEEAALSYADAYDKLRNDPKQGIKTLTSIPKWTGSTISQRVKLLGEGPEFQYEFFSRYTHSDVWSVINDYAVTNKEVMKYVMIGWGIEFIYQTLKVIEESGDMPKSEVSRFEELSKRVETLRAE